MKGYSENRQYYIQRLVKKYVETPVYTVTKNNMREAIYIEGENCSKCMMLKPHVQKRCEENGVSFQPVKFDDISVQEFDVQAVPMLVIREDGIVNQILNEEGIVALISNK